MIETRNLGKSETLLLPFSKSTPFLHFQLSLLYMAISKGKCVQWKGKWGKLAPMNGSDVNTSPDQEVFALLKEIVDGQPLTVGDIVEYELNVNGPNRQAHSIRKLQSAPEPNRPERAEPRRRGSFSDNDDDAQQPFNQQHNPHNPPYQHNQQHAYQSHAQSPSHQQYQQPPQQNQPPLQSPPQHQQHHAYPQIQQQQYKPHYSPPPQQTHHYQAPLQHNPAQSTPEGFSTPGGGCGPARWACSICTFDNHGNVNNCGMCGTAKPQAPPVHSPQSAQHVQSPHQPAYPHAQPHQQPHQPPSNYGQYDPYATGPPRPQPIGVQVSEEIDEDEETRKNWQLDDMVEVFSGGMQKWSKAKIIDVDPRGVWLTVRYVEVAKKKEIKRMDPNIRPIPKGGTAPCTPEPQPVVQEPEEPQIVYSEIHKKIEAARLENVRLKHDVQNQRMKHKHELDQKRNRHESELQSDRQKDKELEVRIKSIEERVQSASHEPQQQRRPYDDWKGNDYPQQHNDYSQQHNDPPYNAHGFQNYGNDPQPQAQYDPYRDQHKQQPHRPHMQPAQAPYTGNIPQPYEAPPPNSMGGMGHNTSFNVGGGGGPGKVYLQKGFYTSDQMNKVQQLFSQNPQRGPKFLFGDNYADKYRSQGAQRQAFGGQSKVMGHHDRTFGFGIPTTFGQAQRLGFTFNSNTFQTLVKGLFDQLVQHIQNGGDVVVPYPTDKDLKRAPKKYFKDNERFVFHNLGTGGGSLTIDELMMIQNGIERLKEKATRTIECDTAYNK
eukprot:267987_1